MLCIVKFFKKYDHWLCFRIVVAIIKKTQVAYCLEVVLFNFFVWRTGHYRTCNFYISSGGARKKKLGRATKINR